MKRPFSWFAMIIFILIAIGILANFRQFLIPIVVLGLIYLLYKFPPHVWRTGWKRWTGAPKKPQSKRSSSRFQVIEGQKKDENQHPYH